jgi:tRNA modification GTPase
VIEVPVVIGGQAVILVDTAGTREGTADSVEQEGIRRAMREVERADLVLAFGPPPESARPVLRIAAKSDLTPGEGLAISAHTGEGLQELEMLIAQRASEGLGTDPLLMNARQRRAVAEAGQALRGALLQPDLVLKAEHLRAARVSLGEVTGRAGVEPLLDALFGRFCIGK